MGAMAIGRTKVCEILIFVKFIDQKLKIQKVLDPKIEYMYRCLYCDYHVLYPMYFCTVNKKGGGGEVLAPPLLICPGIMLYGYGNFQKKCCFFLAIRLIWI